MSETRKYFKDISKDCEERNIAITEVNFEEEYVSGMQKVNWYEEELHKFYSEDKDNNGFIHGIYYYDDLIEFNVCEVEWYQTEEERDRKFESKTEEKRDD